MRVALVWLVACSGGTGRESEAPVNRASRVALISDSHVIDSYYTCCESTDLDTESLQSSGARLEAARDAMNALDPLPAALFVAGDVVHEFPSDDRAFYDQNETSVDIARRIYDGFTFPVHLAMGNHDYDVPYLTREFTHELFRTKLGLERTWNATEVQGFLFLTLDSQMGPTWDPADPLYDRDFGSFGEEQLAFVEEQLARDLPTFLMFHHPPFLIRANESTAAITDLFALVEAHDNVEAIFTGHVHLWQDLEMMWGVPGWGLAATRYDSRNWWLLELDGASGTWEIPASDDVTWGSYWYDGEEPNPGAARERSELGAVAYPESVPLVEVAGDWSARLGRRGLRCDPSFEVSGQGLAAACFTNTGVRHLLVVSPRDGRVWASVSPQHAHDEAP